MGRSEWWVYCVELDAEGVTLDTIRNKSPDWDANLPQVFINASTTDPRVLFAEGFKNAKHEPVAAYGTRLREDLLCEGGLTQEEALRMRRLETDRLRETGYGVLNPKPRQTHRVYVKELPDPAVRDRADVKRDNPNADPSMPCVYIGQTRKGIRARLAQHRRGRKSGKGFIEKYGHGGRVRWDLFDHLNPCYPDEALKKERELAEDLRAQGYTVTGGH
jgi:hypothetical protein